jgi:hypothetical protein
MKYTRYLTACIGGIALLLAGCYDDQGSYDYQAINEIVIDTAGFPTTYTAEVAGQLVIDPKIAFSLSGIAEEDLSYEWYFYSNALLSSDWYPVSREKKLDLKMIYNAGTYRATLYVTDTRRDLTSHMTFNVNLISKISHGMLLFHTGADGSDFDYVATTNTVQELEENVHMRNVFQSVNGRPLRGNPLTVRHTAIDGRAVNCIYVSTDQEFLRLYARNFLLEHDAAEMLVPPLPDRLHFEHVDGQGGSSITAVFFINDGVLYRVAYGMQYYTDYSIPSPQGAGAALAGEVRLAPFTLRPTTSGSGVYNPTFYDAAGKRFVYLANIAQPFATLEPYPAQVPTGLFDVTDIGKDLLFVDRGYNYHAYAIFTGGPGDYWLYDINLPLAGSYNPIATSATDMSYGKHDMSALPGIADAVGFDVGVKGHVLLYATGRDIYACDYQGANPDPAARTVPVTATRVNDDFPAGEEITGIKIYKYDGGIYSQGGGGASDPSYIYYNALNGSLLYVSTWNGTQGKLYEFALSPVDGRLTSKTPLNVFEGFGRIVDMGVKIQYRESY